MAEKKTTKKSGAKKNNTSTKKVVEKKETKKDLELKKMKEENEKLKATLEQKLKEEEKEEKKELFKKIWNWFWWIVLIIWIVLCLTDFFNVQKNNDPIFCYGKTTTEYKADHATAEKYGTGKVTYCYGLGYKVYRYDRSNYKALSFGPFWGKDITATLDEDTKTDK